MICHLILLHFISKATAKKEVMLKPFHYTNTNQENAIPYVSSTPSLRIHLENLQFRTYLPLLHYVFISRTCNSVRIFHAFTTYPSREPAIPYVFSPRDIMRSSSLNPLYNSWNRNFLPLFSTQNYKLIDLKGSYSLPFCRWKEYRIRSFTERPLIFSRASL